MDSRISASVAALMAGIASSELALKMARSSTWTGLRGQRSSLTVRKQTPPAYQQGARECARRRRQMGIDLA